MPSVAKLTEVGTDQRLAPMRHFGRGRGIWQCGEPIEAGRLEILPDTKSVGSEFESLAEHSGKMKPHKHLREWSVLGGLTIFVS